MLRIYAPSPELAEFISCFWALPEISGAHTELVYPDGKIQILFHYGTPFVDRASSGASATQPRFALCGQKTSYSHVTATKECGMVGAVLHTHAASRILGIPVFEITGHTVNLADVLYGWRKNQDAFLDCGDDRSRITVIEKFLLRKTVKQALCADYFVKSCIDEINKNRGIGIPLESLERFSLSERSMQRIFRERTGLTPKKYAKIVRFKHSIALLPETADLTSAAYEAGFYDQSHFIREFKEFCGLSPSEFAKAV